MAVNVNLNETVTLSRSTYEEMKEEIARLRRENAEKTIYEKVPHPVLAYAFLIFVIMMFCAWVNLVGF